MSAVTLKSVKDSITGFNSDMSERGDQKIDGGDNNLSPIIQTLNVIPQKVIQVDKPAGYYKNKEKTKIFIY